MRQRSSAILNVAGGLVVLTAGIAAYAIASRPTVHEGGEGRTVIAKPAETVVVRSPADRNAAAAKLRAAAESAEAERVLLSPYPMHPQMLARAVVPAAPAATVAAHRAAPAPVRLASVASKPVIPAAERAPSRPRAVLNDAQIASIKRRLNLTPDQERMWPSVEAALRNLAYAKDSQSPHKGGARDAAQAVASIDPASPDVQNLKSAAFPLIMSFSDNQMRELQDITRVAGLDKLVSGF
jgi:hypothetical protein